MKQVSWQRLDAVASHHRMFFPEQNFQSGIYFQCLYLHCHGVRSTIMSKGDVGLAIGDVVNLRERVLDALKLR